MSEYIDRQAVLDELDEDIEEFVECDYALKTAKKYIKKIPLAAVRPVVRGRWVVKNSDGSWRVDVCSCCKKEMHYINYAPAYDYCPNCGADMREAQP